MMPTRMTHRLKQSAVRAALLLVMPMLLLLVMPVSAQSSPDLTGLANYAPAGTDIYLTIRTDQAFIDQADALLERLRPGLPNVPPTATVSGMLDQLAGQIGPGGNFESTLRPWLGDHAAIFIPDATALVEDTIDDMRRAAAMDPRMLALPTAAAPGATPDATPAPTAEPPPGTPMVLALQMTDRAAAQTVLESRLGSNGFSRSEQNGATVYRRDNRTMDTFVLADDVLLYTTNLVNPADLLSQSQTLAGTTAFTETLARLPEPAYNALVYLDLAGPLAEALGDIEELPPLVPRGTVRGLLAAGPHVLGFTLLDGDTLTMDFAQSVQDPEALQATGITVGELPPLSQDLIANVPADAALVIHDQNFGPELLAALNALRAIGERVDAIYGERVPARLDGFQFMDESMAFLRLAFQGMSGLSLEQAFGWMNGEHAGYIRLVPPQITQTDLGMVFEVRDSQAAAALQEGLARLFEELALSYELADGRLVLREFSRIAQRIGVPDAESLEIVFVLQDDVFYAGGRDSVQAVISGEDPGLSSDPLYQAEAGRFLADAQTAFYLRAAPVVDFLRTASDPNDRDAQQLADLLALFDTGSITTRYAADGSGTVRFALHLAP